MSESVYCGCGAQWHGQHTDSPVIPNHRERWERGDNACRPMTHAEFKAAFKRCQCEACRRAKSASKKGRIVLVNEPNDVFANIQLAARLRGQTRMEYIKRAINEAMRKQGVDAALFAESDD